MSGASTPEIGLFIIWSGARQDTDRILSKIRDRFEIVALYNVHWSSDLISRNFSRFYRGRPRPPYRTSLEEQKGRGPFLAVIVVDRFPRYGERETTGGIRVVNANIFETKDAVRDWIGEAFTFHSADTAHTAARELVLLFGRSPQSWIIDSERAGSERIIQWTEDPIGTDGWRSMSDLYDALGWSTIYVDLDGGHDRSVGLPDGAPIRLLTTEYKEVLSILGGVPVGSSLPRWSGSFSVIVDGRPCRVEVRSDQDGYLDRRWVNDVIGRRVLQSSGVYTPSDRDLLEVSLYRAFVHQRAVRTEDLERLRIVAGDVGEAQLVGTDSRRESRGLLDAVMEENQYRFTRPRDRDVYYNHRLAGSSLPRLRTVVDGIGRRWEQVLGAFVFAPIRTVVLGAREWLLVRVPLLRSIDGLIRRGGPRSNRTRSRISRRR